MIYMRITIIALASIGIIAALTKAPDKTSRATDALCIHGPTGRGK